LKKVPNEDGYGMECAWIWNLAGRWKMIWAHRRKDSRQLGKGFKENYWNNEDEKSK